MGVVKLEQGTPEWLQWRMSGIGGSDAPVVEGLSPYKTERQLYLEKKGLPTETEEQDNEFIFSRGHAVEKIIRNQFQELVQDEVAPVCMFHDSIPYFLGSFDGFHPKHGVLEGKLVGKEVLEHAAGGDLPAFHYSQIQHLIDVSGADKGQWFGHDGKKKGILLEIGRNDKYIKTQTELKLRFWENLLKGIVPPLSDRDYLVPEDEKLLRELRDAKEHAENAAAHFEALKEQVVNTYGGHPRIAGGGLKIWRSTREGSLNILKVPEISTLVEAERAKLEPGYIEKFRGKSSESWTVKIDQKISKKEN